MGSIRWRKYRMTGTVRRRRRKRAGSSESVMMRRRDGAGLGETEVGI